MNSSHPYQAPENGFRTFFVLWLTQSISVIGSALTYFSITIWLTQVLYPAPEQKGQLALALSAVSLAWGIPHIVIMPIAGAWADRHDRKTTMVVCDYLSGCLTLILMALILLGVLQLWMLIIILVLSTLVGDFHRSAFNSSYSMLVPEHQLARANGMMQTTWSISDILSPAIAAGLIALPALARQGALGGPLGILLGRLAEGTPLAIGVDVLTFFIAGLTPLFLKVPSPKRQDFAPGGAGNKSLWADIKEGALYIWRRRPMMWLLATFTVANFLGSFLSVLRPLVLKYNLAQDWGAAGFTFETALALISTSTGVGGLIGGFFISTWGGLKKRRIYGVLIPMLLVGLMQMLFGLTPWLFIAAGISAFWSGVIPVMNAHSMAIWQGQTPRELQGRVFAVRRTIAQFTFPIGTGLAGLVGGIFSPGLAVAVTGGLLILFCVTQFFNPFLMKVEDKNYLDTLAMEAEGITLPVAVRQAQKAEGITQPIAVRRA